MGHLDSGQHASQPSVQHRKLWVFFLRVAHTVAQWRGMQQVAEDHRSYEFSSEGLLQPICQLYHPTPTLNYQLRTLGRLPTGFV